MSNAEDFYKMGLESKENKDWGDAIKHFTKAIELDPEYADAYYHRGAAYYWLDMLEESILNCEKSIQKGSHGLDFAPGRPDCSDPLFEMAIGYRFE